jgi:hypothetical protein
MHVVPITWEWMIQAMQFINLYLLAVVLWLLIGVLASAKRTLTHINVEYSVREGMREWRAKQYADELQEEEGSLTK